jgi:hypothetical protein
MEKTALTFKNFQLIKLWNSLAKLDLATGGSAKFKFGHAINKNILQPLVVEINKLNPLINPPKDFQECREKYLEGLQKIDSLDIPLEEKKHQAEAFVRDFNEEHREVLLAQEKRLKDFDLFFNESQEVSLHTFSIEDLEAAFGSVDQTTLTSEDSGNLLQLVL